MPLESRWRCRGPHAAAAAVGRSGVVSAAARALVALAAAGLGGAAGAPRSTPRAGARLGRRGRRGRRGDEGGGGRGGAVAGGELQKKIVPDLQEGGERPVAVEMHPESGIALVEAAQHVEHQRAVGDGLTELAKFGRHLLELLAVIYNREITLHEVSECGIEMKGTSLTVPKELGLDGEPC